FLSPNKEVKKSPAPSRRALDASGTGVNAALVTNPDKFVVPPGLIDRLFTVKVNEPLPPELENVKVCVGFEKTMLTPPVAVVLTFPNKFATNVVVAPLRFRWGAKTLSAGSRPRCMWLAWSKE